MSDYRIKDARSRFWVILIILFATPLTGAGIDIYVPSLPGITNYFNVSNHLAQLSLTVYLIGYGVFTLIGGPLADRFGRRKLLRVSVFFGTLFAIMAALSPNIFTLITARFLQGAAISGLGVVARASFPDTYQGKTLRKMIPFIMTSWAAGPILAPYLGANLQHWFDWQASFYFLAGYSFIVFLLSFVLPETLQHKHPLKFNTIKSNYLHIFKSGVFLGWTSMSIMFYALLVVFAVIGPFLVEEVMHYTPMFYGNIAVLMGVVWFVGSLIARALARHEPKFVLPKLFVVSIIVGIGILIYTISVPLSVLSLLIPTLILVLLGALVFSASYGASLSLFPQIVGSNSAATGAMLSIGTGSISSLAVILKTNSDVPLFITFFVFFTVASLLYFFYNTTTTTLKR